MDGEAKGGTTTTASPRGSGIASAGWAGLAIVALLALADVAIETWWSGSSMRWWIALPAFALVAASVWLWWPTAGAAKRWGWTGAASWSVGCLFLLLAASAWLPNGLTTGVRMLLQPTATVLTVVTAAAVLLAAFVLFRALEALPSTPRLAARCVVAAMALYAVASLGLALYNRTPFTTLFQGGAAWQRLPRWLQGACVGAFAVLPLAILGQAIRVVAFMRRQQPIRVLLHQATAIVMALLMAVSGLVAPAGAGPASQTSSAGGTPATSATGAAPGTFDLGAAVDQVQAETPVPLDVIQTQWAAGQDPIKFVERLFAASEAELKRPGADPSDVDATAVALGRDSRKIFEFLRNRIVLEPYVGMLRGARGTLAAAAGNTLDRALLAQALLKASRVESRLVSGTLSMERAQVLLSHYLAVNPLGGPLGSTAAGGDEASVSEAGREVAARIGLSPEKAHDLLARASAQADAFWRLTDERRGRQLDLLSGHLRKAGVQPAGAAGVSADALRERLARHYWVQVHEAGGTWSDFDPSFADAQPGTAYATEVTQISGVQGAAVHRFTISLVYCTRVRDSEKREVLLTAEAASADGLFTPMAFQIQPAEPVPDVTGLAGMSVNQKVGVLRKIRRFQGIVRMGTRVTAGRAFDLQGNTYGSSPGALPSASGAGMMGGLLGGGGGEAAAGAQFSELRLELATSGPGRKTSTQTRTLVRSADVEAPNFAPPLLSSEILVQPSWIPAELVSYQALQSIVGLRPLLTEALEASNEGRPARLPTPPVPPFAQHLLPLALLRQQAAAGILRAQPGVRSLVDAPLLTMASQRMSEVNADAGVIRIQRSIDIVANAVSFVGPDGNASQGTFDAALRHGVADCTLEARFLEATYPDDAAGSGASVFERAGLEGRPVFVAAPRDSDTLRRAGLGERDVQWIGENEDAAHRLVVTTTAGGAAGWWSVGPDGTSVLRVSGGWGQGHAEHDAMVTGLKLISFAHCGWELYHGSHHPSTATGWGMFSCVALAGVSGFFMIAGIHAAGALVGLFTVEILNVVATAIMADRERVHVIDLRR